MSGLQETAARAIAVLRANKRTAMVALFVGILIVFIILAINTVTKSKEAA